MNQLHLKSILIGLLFGVVAVLVTYNFLHQPARASTIARKGGVMQGTSIPEVPQEGRPLVLKRVINIDLGADLGTSRSCR